MADARRPVHGLITAERGRGNDKRKPGALVEDGERILRGRSDFPRSLWGEVL